MVMIAAACNKDKFQTKPTLKFKSENGNLIPINAAYIVEFDFTDKEGDVNDTLYVRKFRINQLQVPTLRDSFKLQVPDFPENNQGVIKVQMDYQNYLISAQNPPNTGNPPHPEPDTLMIKFVLKDKGNNLSDTVTTGPIVVIR
jgi:hypothetical protein